MKQYDAIIWTENSNQPGERITIFADNTNDAQAEIERIYGKGRIFTVENEEEASRLR